MYFSALNLFNSLGRHKEIFISVIFAILFVMIDLVDKVGDEINPIKIKW